MKKEALDKLTKDQKNLINKEVLNNFKTHDKIKVVRGAYRNCNAIITGLSYQGGADWVDVKAIIECKNEEVTLHPIEIMSFK